MKTTAILILAAIGLTACVQPQTPVESLAVDAVRLQPASGPLPPEVEARLPADVPLSDVLTADGCYYYRSGGVVRNVESGVPNVPFCAG